MSALALKMLAIVTMLLDHIGYTFHSVLPFDVYLVLRGAGRLAMPLFCFAIAEGYYHTKDVRRYAGRLLIFAVLSELPFDLLFSGRAMDWSSQNVFFTLFLGLIGIHMVDIFLLKNMRLFAMLSLFCAGALAQLMGSDYGMFGVAFVFVFYLFRDKKEYMAASFALVVLLLTLSQTLEAGSLGLISLCELLSLLFILRYNGRKGFSSRLLQWFFYAFYPLHLLVLYAAAKMFGVS